MIVLAVPDPQCPAMRPDFPDFLSDQKRAWKPDKIVIMGDLVDNHCINYHEKSPNADSGRDEIAKTRDQIKTLEKVLGTADVLIGNHDALPQRKAMTLGIPQDYMKQPWEVWETNKFKWLPRYLKHEIDGVIYAHGDFGSRRGAANPAFQNAKDWWKSVVQGHWHANFEIKYEANEKALIWGMQVGCGMDHDHYASEYGKQLSKKPILGCGIVYDKSPILEAMKL